MRVEGEDVGFSGLIGVSRHDVEMWQRNGSSRRMYSNFDGLADDMSTPQETNAGDLVIPDAFPKAQTLKPEA